ncbi:MAG TPA: endopeptidase La [Solirubrobacterales bacterium]|jgi:ATP-dependent Lon protease|nr:endopeptidase La [Solirubrobacterales bacterium]
MIEISSSGEAQQVEFGGSTIPDTLPVLPLRDTVTFPDTLTPLAIGQERSIQLVNDALAGNRMIAMVASKDPENENPGPDQLYRIGVVGTIARMMKMPDGTLRILVQGSQRVHLVDFTQIDPYLAARVIELPDIIEHSTELEALVRSVQASFNQIVENVPYLPEELMVAVANVDDPSALVHVIAGSLRLKTEEKQELLEEADVSKRLRKLAQFLAREADVIAMGSKIQSQVQEEVDRSQREFFLRQQLKAIQDELGESDPDAAEARELRDQIEQAELPEDVRKAAERELDRLERLPAAAAEYGVIRTYLEWIISLPWSEHTKDNLDLKHARGVLDDDHYDIDKVKDRLIEFLAVRKLKPDARGSILCLVGPPGVGKTSLGRSVARAMGRQFERISVGGVRDEAEIRGHRRTYIGAMPGTIIRAMRDAGSNNPVLMIDEIDKMGSDFRGDPASAMLEVLDPEQNSSFRDHYLDLPFDLSNVMFIATANMMDPIPGALRDRMEVIQLSGYTEQDKLQIAKRYLVPRQIERNGLTPSKIAFADDALQEIISGYTREAGVRGLEREIGAVCRKVAREFAEGSRRSKRVVRKQQIPELLGPRKVRDDARRRADVPGVATGLAWTPVGGDVLFIEATAYPGKGALQITGQLGDVMRESAMAALSYIKGHATEIGADIPDDWFAKHDIHIHVPAGAVPKDGPSAGITMATALASLITGRCVRHDVAMTGEMTLTGQVLPIGGLKEKSLAAQQAEIKTVIAPKDNEVDVEEIPKALLRNVKFRFVETIDQVLEIALEKRRSPARVAAIKNGAGNGKVDQPVVKKPVAKATAKAARSGSRNAKTGSKSPTAGKK